MDWTTLKEIFKEKIYARNASFDESKEIFSFIIFKQQREVVDFVWKESEII